MRLRYDRENQLINLRQNGWRIVTFKNCSLVVAFCQMANKIHAKGWTAKRDKPDWYYTFRDMARAEVYVEEMRSRAEHWETRKTAQKADNQAKRAALKASDHWTIGDVIYNSWGYDQTNIDWYQVVEVKARSIMIQEIGANSNDHGGPSGGTTMPARNSFHGEPMLKPLDERGQIAFKHGCGTKWDGRPQHCSSYA